jgi:hypothetical protein
MSATPLGIVAAANRELQPKEQSQVQKKTE